MAPSVVLNNALGSVGGGVLAACLVPQLVKLYQTRSARDLSYLFLLLYTTGLVLSFVYLFYEGATAGWICLLIELGFACTMVGAKTYLDRFGPYSERGRQRAQRGGARGAGALLAGDIRIDMREFAAGLSAPFPLLTAAPSHAAQHLLLEARLALPGSGPAGSGGKATAAEQRNAGAGSVDSSVKGSGAVSVSITADGSAHGGGAGLAALAAADAAAQYAADRSKRLAGVLQAVGDMLEAALSQAGLAPQGRQLQTFPSFRHLGQAGAGAELADEAAKSLAAAPHMLFMPYRDGYASALFYPATATLSLDMLAASDDAVTHVAGAAQALCAWLAAEWPGTQVVGGSVARLLRA